MALILVLFLKMGEKIPGSHTLESFEFLLFANGKLCVLED